MEARSAPQLSTVHRLPASFHAIAAALTTQGSHLGDLIWWNLSDARIPRALLEHLWTGTGLALNLLPEPPSAEKALKTAVRECQMGKPDLLIRLGKESEVELVFALVRERKDGAGNVEYHQEARVTLGRSGESVSTDDPQHSDVTHLVNTFHSLRHTHTADDVRRALVKALHAFSAVSLREGGGIYWVPHPFAHQLRQLQSAIEQIGASRFYLLPVHDSADAAHSLGSVARGSLEEELTSLQEEIAQFQAEPPERASTLERRLDAFAALRARADLYRDILSVQVDGLERHLAEMEATVSSLLLTKQAA